MEQSITSAGSPEAELLRLFVLMLWAMSLCMLGYPLLRVHLVVGGILSGAAMGAFLTAKAAEWHGTPGAVTGLDLLIVCGGVSIIMGVASWFLYRLFCGVITGAIVCAIVVLFLFDLPPTSRAWIIGALAGIPPAVLVLIYTRTLVVLLSSLFGAAGAVYCAAAMAADGPANLYGRVMGPPMNVPLAALLGMLALTVAIFGMCVQFRLPKVIGRMAETVNAEKDKSKKQAKSRKADHDESTAVAAG